MTLEQTMAGITSWIADLSSTLNFVNGLHSDGITLSMPRDKDLIVTFEDDYQAVVDQCPAIVINVGGFKWDSGNVGDFKGALHAKLYLCDEDDKVNRLRVRIMRWADALTMHCKKQSAILGPNSRVFPRVAKVRMATTKSDVNAFELTIALEVTFAT